jgi:hypothetical protein
MVKEAELAADVPPAKPSTRHVTDGAMAEDYITAAAIVFGAIAVRSSYSVVSALRRPTIAASVRAYESSKWAFVAFSAFFSALFFIHVFSTYWELVGLLLLNLAAWRLTANYATNRRDIFAGFSGRI